MQRLFDILFSGLALLVFLPLLVPIALILRFTGEGEIFFLQSRVGLAGKSFQLYKFATMLKDSPNIGAGTFTIKDDPRVLPVGKVLRKTKINELPQLLNILIGDMSIVGPRPLVQEGYDGYSEEVKEVVASNKPGLSGIGSLVLRNEEEIINDQTNSSAFYFQIIIPYKGKLELWYAKNRNLKNYFKIIAATVLLVMVPRPKFVFSIFKNLPGPPDSLSTYLK